MNYAEFQADLQGLLVLTDETGQSIFNSLLPRIIDDAEGRIYRDPELDFLWLRTDDVSAMTEGGIRSVAIPAKFIIVEGVSLITPAGKKPTEEGARRIPLLRTDKRMLDIFWPIESNVFPPVPYETYYAIYDMNEPGNTDADGGEPGNLPSSIKIAPTVDGAYNVEFFGTYRPPPLSEDNPTTLLSTRYPELLLAAAMVFGCALLKNWSSMADDPKSAISWEAHFGAVKEVAVAESKRQKSQGPNATPSGPALSRPAPIPPPQLPQAG